MEAKDRVREFSNTTIGQIIPDCPSREFVTRLGLLPGTMFSDSCSWSASNLPQGVLLAEAGFQQTLRHAQLFERKNLFVCSLLLLSQDPSSKDAIEVFVRIVIGAAPES